MRFLGTVFMLLIIMVSCKERLLEKPDNLIPQDKMVKILEDLAMVNAGKTTDISVLHENNIQPMQYIYDKYGIDSLQFVESDSYYASLPAEYEKIYKEVEANLETKAKILSDEKKEKDSISNAKAKLEREQKQKAKLNDTL